MTTVFSKLANRQIRHQTTHTYKVDSQPGDSIWSLESSSGVYVGMYGLTNSLITPEGFCYIVTKRLLARILKCTKLKTWISQTGYYRARLPYSRKQDLYKTSSTTIVVFLCIFHYDTMTKCT